MNVFTAGCHLPKWDSVKLSQLIKVTKVSSSCGGKYNTQVWDTPADRLCRDSGAPVDQLNLAENEEYR